MQLLTYAVALACGALLGCSSSSSANKAPVLDFVDLPATASMPVNGTYIIQGTVTFHDDDDTVKELHLTLDGDPSITATPFPQPVMSGKAPLALSFSGPAALPGAVFKYSLSVVDDRGAESTTTTRSVTLQ